MLDLKANKNIIQSMLMTFGMTLALTCSGEKSHPGLKLSYEINTFVKALIEKDESLLVSDYLEKSKSFSTESKLNTDIYNFLYMSDQKNGKKAVTEIVSIINYKTKVVWQSYDVLTLLITNSINYSQFSSVKFLEESWMKEYIACEFIIKENKLVFYQNVCFAETGGPFSKDYDIWGNLKSSRGQPAWFIIFFMINYPDG